MRRIRHESGQSMVIAVVFLVGLLGMTAIVLDVGSWFRAHRAAQATADASALAGAQGLPNTAQALAWANQYGKANGGSNPSAVTFSNTVTTSDTIKVRVTRSAPGFFSSVLGFAGGSVTASAAARSFQPGEARYVAPIVVNIKHPKLTGTKTCPCFGAATTITLGPTGAPGAFSLLNLVDPDPTGGSSSKGTGTTGTSTLADWIENGYDKFLPLGRYYSDPGAKFNSSDIQNALIDRVGTDLLFPVYDNLLGQGSNAKYRIVAWVAFHLTGISNISGTSGTLSGYFKKIIWTGLEVIQNGKPAPDLGVRSVELIQ